MLVYIVMGLIIILLSMIFKVEKNDASPNVGKIRELPVNVRNQITYITLVTVMLILVTGMREYNVGSDTLGYVRDYVFTGNKPFGEIFSGAITKKSPGYAVLIWLLYQVIPSPRIYLIIAAAMFYIPLALFIHKNSKRPKESYFIFYCLFFTFQLTGLRQSMAMGILLLSYEFIKNRNFIKFLICIAFASSFHITSVIFIIAYFLPKLKVRWRTLLLTIVMVVLIYINRVFLFEVLKRYTPYDYYEIMLLSEPINYSIMVFGFTLMSFIFLKKDTFSNMNNRFIVNVQLISCILIPFMAVNGSIRRIVMYFFIFSVLAVPQIISNLFKQRSKKYTIIARMVFYTIIFIVFLLGISGTSYEYIFL